MQGSAELLYRATSFVNGTLRFLDPWGSKTPKPIDIKLDQGDYVGNITPRTSVGISIIRGWGLYICVKLSSTVCLSIFYTPLLFIPCALVNIELFDIFSCFMAQKACLSDINVLFGVRAKHLNNFHYFSQKLTRNSLFSHCKKFNQRLGRSPNLLYKP